MTMEVVEKTWAEVGCKVRPIRRWVMVRTLPVEQKIGSLYVTPKESSFYGVLPHMRNVRAIVLSAGDKAFVKPGEEVVFSRLHFALWKNLEDGCKVGWIDENQLLGYAED